MERKRDEATLELLKQLRMKLMSNDISKARVAAFNLSWLQEDGLAILKEALFGKYPSTAKKAAAYGMRSMRGRMKTMATEVLEMGLAHEDKATRETCKKSLGIMRGEIVIPPPKRKGKGGQRSHSKREIRSVNAEPKSNSKSYTSKPHSSRRD